MKTHALSRSAAPLFLLGLSTVVTLACGKEPQPCDACDGGVSEDMTGAPADLPSIPADLPSPPADLPSPAGADPSMPGPRRTVSFPVRVPISANANLNTTVIGPSDDGQTISQRGAPYPVVVVSPGFSLPTSQFLVDGRLLRAAGGASRDPGALGTPLRTLGDADRGRPARPGRGQPRLLHQAARAGVCRHQGGLRQGQGRPEL